MDESDSTVDELQRRFNQMTFVVATRKLAQLQHWVKVSDVFKTDTDAPFLKRAGVNGFDDPRYEKYSQRLAKLRGIRKYMYRMDVLERKLSYDEVTEIFVRVNSLGAKLRSSDLALAQITAKWRHSLETFMKFQAECTNAGFELDLGLHLRNLIAFATRQSRFRTVNSLSIDALQRAWKEAGAGMQFALNFLRSNVSIESPALLSSPYVIVALAYFGHIRGYKISPEESAELRYWALVANAKGRYSRGSSETFLDQDLATLRDGRKVQDWVDRLRLQAGRLDVSPEVLEGRNQRSSLFKTIFLAFREGGAKDWKSNLAISLDHSGSHHKLQFHHIFPKAQLRSSYTSREADDIANLSFVGGKTNPGISDKPPAVYLPPLVAQHGMKMFEAQAIPTEAALLGVENYRSILAERRKRIAARLNEFLAPGSKMARARPSRQSAAPGG